MYNAYTIKNIFYSSMFIFSASSTFTPIVSVLWNYQLLQLYCTVVKSLKIKHNYMGDCKKQCVFVCVCCSIQFNYSLYMLFCLMCYNLVPSLRKSVFFWITLIHSQSSLSLNRFRLLCRKEMGQGFERKGENTDANIHVPTRWGLVNTR